ncbi:MAG TPA: helix-turn-helix domain-containing protein [Mycobacterium sp.]|jgi:transcriptional regulator with XRE-family HTH domain|uniref:helix-turn-helix domain-containing protein n=1 Tax=Mycobacterium sp. TaxID=1785 RepID=UPI002F3F1662
MTPCDTRTDPAIIRVVLEHAEHTSMAQTAEAFGVSRKAVAAWRRKRREFGPQWPSDEDIATWRQLATERAEIRKRAREHAVRYRARRRAGYRVHIDPTGTMRRLQGLFALGHTAHDLAPALNVSPSRVNQIASGHWDRVHVNTRDHVIRVYDLLSMIRPEGWRADRQRRYARKVGWIVPLAWDDDVIDDPNAKPAGLKDNPKAAAIIDEAAIERRIAGDRTVKLHKGETEEVARRLIAAGVSSRTILHDYGIKAERYGVAA